MPNVGVSEILLTAVIGLVGWIAITVFEMNSNMAVISYRVEENYNMIKPIWQEFLAETSIIAKGR
jgi:hypothetical protein|tara:strand:- start:7848 stop:8042 length:195 start_codon:yes stop_codon:yes gene_type:complete